MKRILLSVVLTLVCTVLTAAPPSDFVIRLLNGVTLENATIDSISGSRFIVTGRLPDGSITTKTVSFADLTPESRDALMWQMRDRLMLDAKPGWFFSGPAVAGDNLPPHAVPAAASWSPRTHRSYCQALPAGSPSHPSRS